MKSLVVKRSILIDRHRTSVSVEEAFWKSLKEIAASQGMSLSDLVTKINTKRDCDNLSSAIRLFVLSVYREQIGLRDEGQRAIQRAINCFQLGVTG
jgi:predicted DNA-binding ribbon-helix-helix protein